MYDHHWLMNSQVLTLLRQLRKRLQAEFGICLRLSDADFEQQLARAKAMSVDAETQRIIDSLEERRGAPFRSGDEPPERLYRGHPVLQEPERKADIYRLIYGDELTPAKYYRGQQVLREQPYRVPDSHKIYRGRFNRGDQS